MKVGIITFHRVLNYGAILQTFALQQTLTNLEIDCSVIDYRKEKFEREYRNLKFDTLSIHGIYHTLKCWMVRKKDHAFLQFIENNFNLTGPCYSKDDLEWETRDCDILLTGSDQVFNYYTTHKDSNYYLDFSRGKRKCSYAASFGFSEFDPKYDEQVKKWLDEYDMISVRENEAKKYLEKLLNRDICIHCDPCFLLSKDEWKRFANERSGKKYVLVYSVGKSQDLINTADKLAEKYGLNIIYIKYTYERCGKAKVITDASPEDFIDLIYNAEFVVTNLFHGVAFSMILEKNFYVCIQENVKTNSRLLNLLNHYDLKNRIVNDSNGIVENGINYENVRQSIATERKHAKEYLEKLGSRYDRLQS